MPDTPSDTTAAVHAPLAPVGVPARGTSLQGWVLGERIGTGGSSVVVAATRTSADGFTQHAAVKLLRVGADDGTFVRRFLRERRILQALVHPHIVRLLDGGATVDGLPWYAMERIVGGVPITEGCAGRDLRQRVRWMVQVCRAVDHAHQRLIVHCDLKPANVLVDPEGVPHVLDFGIARLLDVAEATGTVRQLTPRWAAPEQLEGGAVTVATDVHGLGLLLWAVLTGQAPRAGRTGPALWAAARDGVPPPSRTVPACRGDLDAIVLRATAPAPGDRYRTALALAEDLERYLAGDAVHARSGVLGYRVGRWLRRHRVGVVAAVGLASVVVGWAATATVQARRVARARDRAEATLGLLVQVLEAADPAVARGEDLTVREVMGSALRELDASPRDPALDGEIRRVVGEVQAAVGALPEARATLEGAVARLAQAYPEDHPRRLRAELELAYAEASLVDDPEAVARAEALVGRLRDPVEHARGLQRVADLRAVRGDLERAGDHARAALAAHRALGDARAAARSLAILGFVEAWSGQGTATLREALDATEAAVGTRLHPEVADVLHELAQRTEGPEGLRYAEESLALKRALYGEGWPLASTLNNYGLGLEATAPERAVAMMAEAHAMARTARGADHPTTLHVQVNRGAVLVDTGHEAEGLVLLRAAVAHPRLEATERARAGFHVARVEARQGDPAAARATLQAGLALLPPDDATTRPRLEQALAALPISAE